MEYIELTSRNQYGHKNASTARTAAGVSVFISYQTIIAADINGTTFITSGAYSVTTGHHKTDARRYFNNVQEIELLPDALYALAAGEVSAAEIIKESQDRRNLLKELRNQEPDGTTIKDLKYKGTIQAYKPPEHKQYKNGNRDIIYHYKASFKNLPEVYYKVICKEQPVKIQTRTGPALYNKYSSKVQCIEA